MVDDGGTPTAVYSGVLDDNGRVQRPARTQRPRTCGTGNRLSPVSRHARRPRHHATPGTRSSSSSWVTATPCKEQGLQHRSGRPQVSWCTPATTCVTWMDARAIPDAIDDPVAAERLTQADISECPNLLRFGTRWVLIISLWSWTESVILDASSRT